MVSPPDQWSTSRCGWVAVGRDMGAPQTRTAPMRTRFGLVQITGFDFRDSDPPIVSISSVDRSAGTTRLRVQAQCLTSTTFESVMCECAGQIQRAVQLCATANDAAMIYLPQEGRGYGLLSKIEILAQMSGGVRTLREAQIAVGRPRSCLDYSKVPVVLAALGIHEVVLLSESEDKQTALARAGLSIIGTQPWDA